MLDAEESVIREAAQGVAEAFGRLYDHYLPQIYRFVAAKVSNQTEAEDIVHEVFLSAWQNIEGYKHKGLPFSSWLYRIARNRVIDYYRLHKPIIALENVDPDAVKVASSIELALDTKISWDRVQDAMRDLTETEKDVLLLRFVNDLAPREIAAALEKSEGAVRVIQHRAIHALKKRLTESES